MRFVHDVWLYAVLLLPLVWLGLRLADRRAAGRLWLLLGQRAAEHVEGANPRLRGWRRFFLLAGLFFLLLGLARPQWGASEVVVTQRGSDIVVALDISNSMLAEDVLPNRLERAKAELTAFLGRLDGSRVGLVFFAGSAFVQCPLTLDYGTAEIFLRMAAPDMLSEQGTALGTALETARGLLAKGRSGEVGGAFQAILLVTDGEDLEGSWESAARDCVRDGVRLIPVGVGEEGGGLIPVTDEQGRPSGFLKDDEGKVVMTRLDMASLGAMAALNAGSPFRIGVDGLAGDRLFAELERMGKRDLEERRISAYQERSVWPLLLAALAFMLRLLVGSRKRRPHRATALAVGLLALLAHGEARAVLRPAGGDELGRGREYYLAGEYEAALDAFYSALVAAPEDPLISLAMGETLFQLERYEDAQREFARALTLTGDPELRAEALFNGGTTLLATEQLEDAVSSFRESLRVDPAQEDALVNLEAALRRLEQQQQQEQQQDKSDQDQQQQENQPRDEQQDQTQDQPPQDRQEDEQQDQEQQPEQQEQEQQEPPPGEQPEPEEGSEEEQEQQPPVEEMTPEQAEQLLKALDRDEEELKKSVQKRLRGGRATSGKRW